MRFVLFDRIEEIKPGKEARLLKNIAHSEDFFVDHFPEFPIVPGSIILGSFEQGAQMLLAVTHDFIFDPVLEKVTRASFRHFASPGDQLVVRLTVQEKEPASVRCEATVREKRMAEATLKFTLRSVENDKEAAAACGRIKQLYDVFMTEPATKVWDVWSNQS